MSLLRNARQVYQDFSPHFWTLVGASFIDRLGGALIFPFFSLYVTHKFGIGMTQVGLLFAVYSISSMVGSFIGGGLTDRFGRKAIVIFGLLTSALSMLGMGLVNQARWFAFFLVIAGLLSDTAGPAQQAMVVDLVGEDKRAQGFAIQRVNANLAVTLGPMIGGLLAARSYLLLFVADAIASTLTALVVLLALPETRSVSAASKAEKGLNQTFQGYSRVLRDRLYMAFLMVAMLTTVVYMQMNTTLSVYLRDVHNVPPQGFGYILSLNAGMVVLFQFWITRKIGKRPPLLVTAAGTALYAVGFAMYGFVSAYLLFLLAMAIITIGEMLVIPASSALVAHFAPEEMRGRYMAIYGFSWVIPSAVGPTLAGLIMDHFDPRWVWWAAGLVGMAAAVGYAWLHARMGVNEWEEQISESGRLSAKGESE